jgi:dolichol-phosphate mannosyltransferase
MQEQLHVSVVIPTFNERNNVGPLISRLESALAGMPAEIVFVDDSNDGTEDVIRRRETPLDIRVIHRPPHERAGGLSTAVLRGVDAARGKYVCVMDGDLQHPPETIPQLVARAEDTGAEIVIASRNVSGGRNDGLDGPWRRFVSWTFGMMSRVLFYEKLRKVTDPLSGFFLVRRSALEGITMRPVGYKISLEILIRAAGSHVEEVPYTFAEREADVSNATFGTGFTFFRHVGVLLLEVPEVGRFWKFAFVGGSGMLVFMAALWLTHVQLGLPSAVAWLISAELAVLSNFTLNRNVTWFERRSEGFGNLVIEAAKYHVASAPALAANAITFFFAIQGVGSMVAGAIAVWVGVATSFLGAEKFVFTTRRAIPLRRKIIPVTEPSGGPPSSEPAEPPTITQGRPVAPGPQEER